MGEALVPPAPMTKFALCHLPLEQRPSVTAALRAASPAYLGTGPCAVHDGVAAVEREGVLQLGQALLCELVSGVDHPAIGLGTGG